MGKQDNPLSEIFVEKFIILKTVCAFSLWRFYSGFWDDELCVVQFYLGLWLRDLNFYFHSPYLHTLSPLRFLFLKGLNFCETLFCFQHFYQD